MPATRNSTAAQILARGVRAMLKRIRLLAVAVLCSGCPDYAGNCHHTLTCVEPADAGPTIIYVVSDAGCDGVCVPIDNALGWGPPMLLAKTKATQSPACPGNAPNIQQIMYADPIQSLPCPTCSCEPPTGVCMMPQTMTANTALECPSDAGVPFNPPDAWDGGCTTNDAIDGGACDSGFCVKSVTVAAVTPNESACVPTQSVTSTEVTWQTIGYNCAGSTNSGVCASPSDVCAAAPSTGYALCISREGDDPLVLCPMPYPHRSVFYLSANDMRGCSTCTCDLPQGGACSSLVSIYADDACSTLVGVVTATSDDSMCIDVPPGSPLGSRQATPPTYTPGSCQPSGGQETGSAQPEDPFTFCCQ